jgi:AraC-like DNA-binding protein
MVAVLSPGEFCAIRPESARFIQIAFTAEEDLPVGAFYLTEQEELILDALLAMKEADARLLPLADYLLLCCKNKEPVEAVAIAKDAAIFADATALLQENVSGQLSVDSLAEQLGISLSHLKRIFARYAGKGAHEFFTDLKIAYAKELLREGHSVTRTAELAGFANQAYFSAAFKRITGQNPKEFSGKKKASAPPVAAPRSVTPRPRKAPAPQPKPQPKRDLPSYLL